MPVIARTINHRASSTVSPDIRGEEIEQPTVVHGNKFIGRPRTVQPGLRGENIKRPKTSTRIKENLTSLYTTGQVENVAADSKDCSPAASNENWSSIDTEILVEDTEKQNIETNNGQKLNTTQKDSSVTVSIGTTCLGSTCVENIDKKSEKNISISEKEKENGEEEITEGKFRNPFRYCLFVAKFPKLSFCEYYYC